MDQVYTIITTNGKFSISGFTRTIENNGGFPYVKYISTNGGTFFWSFYDTTKPTSIGFTKNFHCYPGDEIIVIGESIHFSTNPATGFHNELQEFITNILKK